MLAKTLLNQHDRELRTQLFRHRLLKSAGPIEAFKVVCAELWLRFRIPRAAYGVLLTPAHGEGKPSAPSLIGTYPAGLLKVYAAERHDLHDPTLWNDRNFTIKPRRWIQACNEVIRNATPEVRRVVEVAESFGNEFGYSIPVRENFLTRRRAAFGIPKNEDMRASTFDDQIVNEIRAQELQDIFRTFHQIVPDLNGFRDGLFLTVEEAYLHRYYRVESDWRSSNVVALRSRSRRIGTATIGSVPDPRFDDEYQRYDEEIARFMPPLVTLARGSRCRTEATDKGWAEQKPYFLAEDVDETRSSLGVILPGAKQFLDRDGTITTSNQNSLTEQPIADPSPRATSCCDAVEEHQPTHPLRRRPTEDEIEAAIATIREAMASIGIEEEQAARIRDEIVRMARGNVESVYAAAAPASFPSPDEQSVSSVPMERHASCIPTWKDRSPEDENIKPLEFIKKYYASEINNGSLTQADIRKRDPGLYQAYHNWRKRNSDVDPGFYFPTKKERNDRLLSNMGSSSQWLAKTRRDADPETLEAMRLYDVARARRRSADRG